MANDGSLDRSWPIRGAGRASVLSLSGGRLYLGSSLGVEALDAATGASLWRSPKITPRAANGRNERVVALAATPSAVYLAGDFSAIGGERRALVAALDARDGHLLPWRMAAPALTGTDAHMVVLAVSGGRLYVGGSFDSIGGRPRPGIAAVSTRDATLLPWSPAFNAWDGATSIAVAGRTVLVGGTFNEGGAFDAVTAQSRPSSPAIKNATVAAVSGSTAYIGGNLRSTVRSQRTNLAAFDPKTGRLRPWEPSLERFVSISRLALSGGRVLVGGEFCNSIG
jgi:outer membrane protein assembly factor BamB